MSDNTEFVAQARQKCAMSDQPKQDCQDCNYCIIVEDRNYDYPPSAYCLKKHEIIELDICDFAPKEHCKDFEEGEAAYE